MEDALESYCTHVPEAGQNIEGFTLIWKGDRGLGIWEREEMASLGRYCEIRAVKKDAGRSGRKKEIPASLLVGDKIKIAERVLVLRQELAEIVLPPRLLSNLSMFDRYLSPESYVLRYLVRLMSFGYFVSARFQIADIITIVVVGVVVIVVEVVFMVVVIRSVIALVEAMMVMTLREAMPRIASVEVFVIIYATVVVMVVVMVALVVVLNHAEVMVMVVAVVLGVVVNQNYY
ncbi:unnamed protein product [Protopolystoma xenopodis]|uniref:Uncharacterized protein n=1 Tax=Protopolystoma xenopodis TaxID=117903 RepID=A0A448XCX3_9PLAT|nr:unnamed protein product [Protopolystoma xenopodis]